MYIVLVTGGIRRRVTTVSVRLFEELELANLFVEETNSNPSHFVHGNNWAYAELITEGVTYDVEQNANYPVL